MKAKQKREGPLKVNMPFDQAIGRALTVKPPPGGWGAYEARLRHPRKRAAKAK